MDRTDYHDKMNELVNDKQTYEELKRDPRPTLQRQLNSKLLELKKTDAIDIRRYYRLRCPVPQPPRNCTDYRNYTNQTYRCDLSWVSFCGSPTYQLSKYLTTVLQPLTDQYRHKLQSTENFVDDIKTAQIPDDQETSVFSREITVHQYSTSTASELHWDSHYDLYCQTTTTTTYRRHHGPT